MSNKPAPPAAQAPAAPAAPPSGTQVRIAELQAALETVTSDIRTAQGRLSNRDPQVVGKLKNENAELAKRFELLKSTLFAMITESYQARNADEFKLQYEVLKLAALEYFKITNTDPELWKSIAS
jgi:hypothetical protein